MRAWSGDFSKIRSAVNRDRRREFDPASNGSAYRKSSSTGRAHALTPRTTTTRNEPVLRATEAQLYVADVTASCAFFTSKLGFAVAFVYGDPPFYGQVYRDKARLNLRMVGEPVFIGDIREREQLLSASITIRTTDEIKQLFSDFRSAGVRFHQDLKKEPWGARTFIVTDCDGNLILFAGPAE